MRGLIFAALAACLAAAHGAEAQDGGRRMINDKLPPGAKIYKAALDRKKRSRHVSGTESDRMIPLVWNELKAPAPCSAIRDIDWHKTGPDKHEIGLNLKNQRYGGKYYPHPPPVIDYWIRPQLWASYFDEAEARALADYCGVEMRIIEQ